VLVVQRVFRAKRTNLHEKYDYPCRGGLQLGQKETRRGERAWLPALQRVEEQKSPYM